MIIGRVIYCSCQNLQTLRLSRNILVLRAIVHWLSGTPSVDGKSQVLYIYLFIYVCTEIALQTTH